MLLGLHGSVATFQRLTDWVLALHQWSAAACLGDIIIYLNEWDQHLKALLVVLQELWLAG